MHEQEALIKVREIEEAIIGIRADGIGQVFLKSNTELDVKLQLKLLAVYEEITAGKPTDFIFEAGEYVSITREARENAKNMETLSPVRAIAAVVTNLAYRLIADFYYKVNKPKKPFKVVATFEDGLKWLKKLEASRLEESMAVENE